jgi:aspartyl-tRNA(Asn)/glutamyl-tRNA(Gln) amidotransferase subunit C
MALTKKEVDYVARLARLALTENEKENFSAQLSQILEYFEQLKKVDTAKVHPTAHPFFTHTVWREDRAVSKNDKEAILANAPEREDDFFKVKKVIE